MIFSFIEVYLYLFNRQSVFLSYHIKDFEVSKGEGDGIWRCGHRQHER